MSQYDFSKGVRGKHHKAYQQGTSVNRALRMLVDIADRKQFVYAYLMIKTFSDSETERFFDSGRSRRIGANIRRRAAMRLLQLHNATSIEDLRVPPSNRLEKLSGDREGQWSIRVNQQWRVCFRFEQGDAYDVEITDYH